MRDPAKINEELTNKISDLQSRIQELEQSESKRKQIEEQLRESEERFDQLAEQSRTFTWEVDGQGLFTFASRVSEVVIGYRPGELVEQKHFYDLHPDEGREEFKKNAFTVFGQKEAFLNLVNPVQAKGGNLVWVSTNGIPLLNTDGTLRGYRGSDIDITAWKVAKDNLLISEEKYREIFNNTVEGIYRSTPAGRFVLLNPASARICGYESPEEMMEKVTDIANQIYARPEDRLRVQHLIATEGIVQGIEVQFKHPKKERIWISLYAKAIFDGGGSIRYYDGTIEDITDRKRAEQALRNSEGEAKRLSQENELMAEIGQIISSTIEIEEVYGRFAEKVREIIPFDRIAVNTVNMKDYTRTIRYVLGDTFSGNKIGNVLSLAGSGTEQLVQTKSSLLINSKNRDEMISKYHGRSSLKFGAQSMMLVPLISQDAVFGALFIYSAQVDAYSEKDLRLAERVGSQIAGAIANAELFLERTRVQGELEEERRQLRKTLDEVRTLRGIVPICSYCKQIRNDEGFWSQVEQYVSDHTDAKFSHAICPTCFEREMKGIQGEK